MSRPPLPPFTRDSAAEKVRLLEDAWNSRDPWRVLLSCTVDSLWRDRTEHLVGRPSIEAFLIRKWRHELEFRLVAESWIHAESRIAIRFAYEYRNDSGQWFRAHGNEHCGFFRDGLLRCRLASINERPIAEAERRLAWPLGRRPDDHPGLSEMGL